jgi:hypothetical protein
MLKALLLTNINLVEYHYQKLDDKSRAEFHDPKNISHCIKHIAEIDSLDMLEWVLGKKSITNKELAAITKNNLNSSPNILNYLLENDIFHDIHDELVDSENVHLIRSIPLFTKFMPLIEKENTIYYRMKKFNNYQAALLYYELNPNTELFHLLSFFAKHFPFTKVCSIITKYVPTLKDFITHRQISAWMYVMGSEYYPIIFAQKPEGNIPYDLYFKSRTLDMIVFLLEYSGHSEAAVSGLLKFYNHDDSMLYIMEYMPEKLTNIQKITYVFHKLRNIYMMENIGSTDPKQTEIYDKILSLIETPQLFIVDNYIITVEHPLIIDSYNTGNGKKIIKEMELIHEYKGLYIYDMFKTDFLSEGFKNKFVKIINKIDYWASTSAAKSARN